MSMVSQQERPQSTIIITTKQLSKYIDNTATADKFCNNIVCCCWYHYNLQRFYLIFTPIWYIYYIRIRMSYDCAGYERQLYGDKQKNRLLCSGVENDYRVARGDMHIL